MNLRSFIHLRAKPVSNGLVRTSKRWVDIYKTLQIPLYVNTVSTRTETNMYLSE